jgi:hypothetical protein
MRAHSASDGFLHFVDVFQVAVAALTDPDSPSIVAAIRQAVIAIPRELTPDELYLVRNLVTDLVRDVSTRARVHHLPPNVLAEIISAGADGARIASTFMRYLDEVARDLAVPHPPSLRVVQSSSEPMVAVVADDVDHPAAARVAELIVSVVKSPRDPRNLKDLWNCSHRAPGTLKSWCRGARLKTRCVRQFARGLRLILMCSREGSHPREVLDIIDDRPREKFLIECGADPAQPYRLPRTAAEYIEKQTFISNVAILREVRRRLEITQPRHPTVG